MTPENPTDLLAKALGAGTPGLRRLAKWYAETRSPADRTFAIGYITGQHDAGSMSDADFGALFQAFTGMNEAIAAIINQN